MEFRVFGCALTLLLGLCVIAGCTGKSDTAVKTVDVSGKVTLDGQPAEGLAVRFFKSLDHEGIGVTGPGGTYTLGNGAEPGKNKVYFFKVNSVDGEEEEIAGAEDLDEGDGAGDEDKLPAKFNSAETTEITFTVPDGGTVSADFNLSTTTDAAPAPESE